MSIAASYFRSFSRISTRSRFGFRAAAAVLALWAAVPARAARVVRVPADFATITHAVAAAGPGDTVEVDDGFYLEKNIMLSKPLTVRSKNLFGAVIYGAAEPAAAIFIVRAEVEISGFVLKNSCYGILQRDSPDAAWTGRDLALFNMYTGISINDREFTRGRARLINILAERCGVAVETNDAGTVEVRNALIANSDIAFNGADHLAFRVDETVLWNCGRTKVEHEKTFAPPAGNRIELGPRVTAYNPLDLSRRNREMQARLNAMFRGTGEDRRRWDAQISAVLGDIFLLGGDARGAALHYGLALQGSRAFRSDELRWHAEWGLARVAEAAGDAPGAIRYYKKVIDIIEMLGLNLPPGAFQPGFREDKIELYETLIRLLVRAHQRDPGAGYGLEAFRYAEKSKAWGLFSSLVQDGTGPAGPTLRAWAREEKRLGRLVSELQRGIQDPDLAADDRKALLERLEAVDGGRRDAAFKIRGGSVAAKSLPFKDALAVRRELLDGTTALIEYVVGRDTAVVFFLSWDGFAVAEIPPEPVLRRMVGRYLRFLTLPETGDFKGWAGASALRQLLLGPFEERLRGVRSLIVIPDGPLHELPFEALASDGPPRRFLAEDFAVRYGASASCLINLANRPRASWAKEFLGLASPSRVRAFGLSSGRPLDLPALPYAAREIRRLQRFFPAGRRTVLLGSRAGEDVLKTLPLAAYRIVHIAAHSILDERKWWRSSLLLPARPESAEDGFLQPTEIMSLRLAPELLVLSGCGTGSGLLEKGEGLNGLSNAFFAAGARALLLSLWSVNDKATASFMEEFYRHMKEGRSKAEALGLAKTDMLAGPHKHPFYWAGFVLLGN